MSQKTNTNQNLKVYTKAENKPYFINSELLPYYEQTDLELFYVFDCCKSLKPLKGIDVNSQQVEFWYKEFIRMGWTKKIFDKQFEAIKRAALFNRIDLENWLKTEMMYNEYDLQLMIRTVINNKINEGKILQSRLDKNPSYSDQLSDDDKDKIDLMAREIALFRINNNYYEMRDKYKNDRVTYWEQKLGNIK